MICSYGCGKEANHQFKNRKWCCSKKVFQCEEIIKQIKLLRTGKPSGMKGKLAWNKGKKGIFSNDSLELIRKSRKGKISSEETKKKQSEKLKIWWSNPENEEIIKERNRKIRVKSIGKSKGRKMPKEFVERLRKEMKDGKAAYMNKFIKNPSSLELKLRQIVKDLYPNSDHTYPVFNYALDIVLPDHRIAIEFDGYYHFCDQDHIDYHKKRQEKIEDVGWKFIRYNIFQPFPTKEQIKKDIETILNKE